MKVDQFLGLFCGEVEYRFLGNLLFAYICC